MKAINFINWKYIGLAGCLVMSLLAACSDDETASEVAVSYTHLTLPTIA